jgi:hypothetical protein
VSASYVVTSNAGTAAPVVITDKAFNTHSGNSGAYGVPSPGEWELFLSLNAADYDDEDLSIVATVTNGDAETTVLEALIVSVNDGGTLPTYEKFVATTGSDSNDGSSGTPYLTTMKGIRGIAAAAAAGADGGQVSAYPGSYQLGTYAFPVVETTNRWVTIAPATGYDATDVTISGSADTNGLFTKLLRLQDVTITGRVDTVGESVAVPVQHLSLSGCVIDRGGRDLVSAPTFNFSGFNGQVHAKNTTLQNSFNGFTSTINIGVFLNVKVLTITQIGHEGFSNSLLLNCLVDGISVAPYLVNNPGEVGDPPHPDVAKINSGSNTIIERLVAANCTAQGIFIGANQIVSNLAIVDTDCATSGFSRSGFSAAGTLTNAYIKGCKLGSWNYDGLTAIDVVFEDTLVAGVEPSDAVSGVSYVQNAPVIDYAYIPSDGESIVCKLSKFGCTPTSGASAGGFTLAGTSRTVTAWAISGQWLTLTLSGAVGAGDTVTLDYDGTAAIEDVGERALASISDNSITNLSGVVPMITGDMLNVLADDLIGTGLNTSDPVGTCGDGTSSGANRPTWTPASYNGHAGLTMTASQFLALASAAYSTWNGAVLQNGLTVYIAIKPTVATEGQVFGGAGTGEYSLRMNRNTFAELEGSCRIDVSKGGDEIHAATGDMGYNANDMTYLAMRVNANPIDWGTVLSVDFWVIVGTGAVSAKFSVAGGSGVSPFGAISTAFNLGGALAGIYYQLAADNDSTADDAGVVAKLEGMQDYFETELVADLVEGSLAVSRKSLRHVAFTVTGGAGGTGAITDQLQRSPTGAGTWTNKSNPDRTVVAGTTYDYRLASTDEEPATVYSSTVTVAVPSLTAGYTITPGADGAGLIRPETPSVDLMTDMQPIARVDRRHYDLYKESFDLGVVAFSGAAAAIDGIDTVYAYLNGNIYEVNTRSLRSKTSPDGRSFLWDAFKYVVDVANFSARGSYTVYFEVLATDAAKKPQVISYTFYADPEDEIPATFGYFVAGSIYDHTTCSINKHPNEVGYQPAATPFQVLRAVAAYNESLLIGWDHAGYGIAYAEESNDIEIGGVTYVDEALVEETWFRIMAGHDDAGNPLTKSDCRVTGFESADGMGRPLISYEKLTFDDSGGGTTIHGFIYHADQWGGSIGFRDIRLIGPGSNSELVVAFNWYLEGFTEVYAEHLEFEESVHGFWHTTFDFDVRHTHTAGVPFKPSGLSMFPYVNGNDNFDFVIPELGEPVHSDVLLFPHTGSSSNIIVYGLNVPSFKSQGLSFKVSDPTTMVTNGVALVNSHLKRSDVASVYVSHVIEANLRHFYVLNTDIPDQSFVWEQASGGTINGLYIHNSLFYAINSDETYTMPPADSYSSGNHYIDIVAESGVAITLGMATNGDPSLNAAGRATRSTPQAETFLTVDVLGRTRREESPVGAFEYRSGSFINTMFM